MITPATLAAAQAGEALAAPVRVASLADLPDVNLACLLLGHRWPADTAAVPITAGWGGADVSRLDFRCGCGRRRREVVDDRTGEILTRAYGGGVLLAHGQFVPRADARAEFIRRQGLRHRRIRG